MKVDIRKQDNTKLESIDLNKTVFGVQVNDGLVHQVVTAYLSNARSGTKGHKNRSTASGGGIKPWRQKGTGRARAGTIRSPLWVGGGKTFTSDNQNFTKKINKKEYKTAIKSILTSLLKNKRLIVVDTLKIDEPKTKEMSKVLKSLEVDDVLIVVNEKQTNLDLASRNIPKVELITAEKINPVSLISHENVVIDTAGIKKIESIYG
ncbi:MAG TPA: 50S ribosomal protein L4 [Gammaproteobacteria bacterium]|jgi:large subunit ribosomal protein L4|nr:50S ribosomal protein L4 [Gammaproteobacteria bacterium]HIK77286.1 50S ribosomal protein L4 [Gammaproteobacteria bacterium]